MCIYFYLVIKYTNIQRQNFEEVRMVIADEYTNFTLLFWRYVPREVRRGKFEKASNSTGKMERERKNQFTFSDYYNIFVYVLILSKLNSYQKSMQVLNCLTACEKKITLSCLFLIFFLIWGGGWSIINWIASTNYIDQFGVNHTVYRPYILLENIDFW